MISAILGGLACGLAIAAVLASIFWLADNADQAVRDLWDGLLMAFTQLGRLCIRAARWLRS
jgi:hypothetical protein